MKLNFCALVVICFGSVVVVRPAESVFTIDEAVRFAVTNNPSLQAARVAIREAEGRLMDSGRLPNPELESSFAPNITGGERTFTIGFSQHFPVTARLRLEREISKIEVARAQSEAAEFERLLAFQVRTAAVTAAMLEARLQLNERQQANGRELQATMRQAASVGEGSDLDLAQLELEIGELLAQQAHLESSRSEILGELSRFLGMHFSTNFHLVAPPLPQAFEPSFNPEDRADYQAAQRRAEAAGQAILLARAERWQDIQIGAFTEIDRTEDAPHGIETDHIVGLRVSIPLPMWNRGKGRLAGAEAAAERARLEAAAVLTRIRAEVSSAAAQMEIATKLHENISKELLPKARQIEERFLTFHKQGLAPFTDVLRARERRLELESSDLEALRDLHLAYARYLSATASILEK